MSHSPFLDLPTPDPEFPSNRRRKPQKLSTLVTTVENPLLKDQYGSSSVPIYQTATFKGIDGDFDYSRSGNPTRSHLEHHVSKISSSNHAIAVSSGMAALDVILRLVKPGEEIITGDDLYGGTNRLLTFLRTHGGVTVHHVDTTQPDQLVPLIDPVKTAMVLLESPTNPLLKIADIAALSRTVKERAPNAVVVVDNTMMSPYLQRPLEHGADISYDSATKYLSGHHDLMAGVIMCNRDDLAQKMKFTVNAIGNALTPNDAFLLLRGIKTLAVRMDRMQSNANQVAHYLHGLGFITHYPGLADHPGRDIHLRIADGSGAVLSFETGDKELSERIVGATRLWGISVSFGAVNSLISMPCVMSHASIDPAVRAARGLPEDLIRLCVGIEDAGDLLDDMECALIEAGALVFNEAENKYVRAPSKVEEDTISKAIEKLDANPHANDREWFISAPGKVILFGEHAVVHGVTAIAASVDLRCYGLTSPREDGKISVHFSNIQNFYHEWDISSLPWDVVTPVDNGTQHPEQLDDKLVDAIMQGPLSSIGDDFKNARSASLAFLYLYMILACGTYRPAFNFTARATLPVGAGLGSSASFSACAASAILLLHNRVQIPPLPPRSGPGHIHVSHHGRRAIPPAMAEEVNRWAFVSEKILHGNPSGVDNSVAVFGGALAYTRPGFNKKSGMEGIQGFKSLRFLLTNSKVPRDTKKLVAGVGQKKLDEPELVDGLLQAIEDISIEARRALADPELPREAVVSALSALIHENHRHLVSLGVSHPALETIRSKTGASPYGLSTKLTGAGGGGCTVTLIPDEFQGSVLQLLVDELTQEQFDTYVTSVGGSGLGILSPYPEHRKQSSLSLPSNVTVPGQVTPPQTPLLDESDVPTSKMLRPTFESASADELVEWAEGLGRWMYV